MNDFTENVISVSEALKFMNDSMRMVRFRIEGEVSSVNDSPKYKGVYFTIKDDKSKLDCIMWRAQYRASNVCLEVGQKVELTGYFSVYAAKGTFSFTAEEMHIAGLGKIMAELVALKKKLADEGLMDISRKKNIPKFSETIGLVTSGAGAAVHDVVHTIKRRSCSINIKFAGVNVEGKGAVESVIEGLQLIDSAGCDCILLVRGGGAFEDLLTFSDERLARIVANCKTPIVTGIGHEPDVSICDLVSDLSCSTPTAAAEIVTAGIYDLIASMPAYNDSFMSIGQDIIESTNTMLDNYRVSLEKCNPVNILQGLSQDVEYKSQALKRIGNNIVLHYSATIDSQLTRLNALSPTNTMKRGFSYVTDAKGSIVKTTTNIKVDDALKINFVDGACITKVIDILD